MEWKEYLKYIKENKKSLVIIGSSKYTKEDSERLKNIIKQICQNYHYFVILPDKGIPLEFIKQMVSYLGKGQKIYLTIPKEDKVFGINHLLPHIKELKSLYDSSKIEEINTENWFVQDLVIGILGDVLFLKRSKGSYGELWYGAYLHKFFWSEKRKLLIPKQIFGRKLSEQEEELLSDVFNIVYF
jgi:hypothetical protein